MQFESFALRSAIAVADINWESDVNRALHRLNRTERNPEIPETFQQWERAHAEFHQRLISGCELPMLLAFCQKLHNLNHRYRRILLQRSAGDLNVVAEHSAMAEAAIARDSKTACSILESHIERNGRSLLNALAGRSNTEFF
jgi:DNA-binding GntR family transcriptional regulator